jgi:hypothetical protein
MCVYVVCVSICLLCCTVGYMLGDCTCCVASLYDTLYALRRIPSFLDTGPSYG